MGFLDTATRKQREEYERLKKELPAQLAGLKEAERILALARKGAGPEDKDFLDLCQLKFQRRKEGIELQRFVVESLEKNSKEKQNADAE